MKPFNYKVNPSSRMGTIFDEGDVNHDTRGITADRFFGSEKGMD